MRYTDLTAPSFQVDPYPVYAKLRQEAALKSLLPGLWISGRHDVVAACLRDRRLGRAYADTIRGRYGVATAQAPIFKAIERMMLLMNPPEHTRLRALLMHAFSIHRVEAFREMSEAAAHRLVDGFAAHGETELVSAFALPMPAQVICALLDVPVESAAAFTADSDTIVQALEIVSLNKAQIEAGNAAVQRLVDHFVPIVRDRRGRSGDDLISRLIRAEEGASRLTEEEIVANIVLLFVAGHETTANLIGNTLVALARYPAERERLRADPSLAPAVARECLRYDVSVQMAGRIALEDLEIDGVTVRRGQVVLLCLGAASRDPDHYPDPDSFRLDRPDTGRTIGFGGGVHYCLGARLAAIELETALTVLNERLPGLSVDLASLRWRARNTVRGPEYLRATW